MKTRLLLFALPCLIFGACNSDPAKDAATQKHEVAKALSFKDSLLNAARKNQIQDSIDATKKDTTKKADTTGAKK